MSQGRGAKAAHEPRSRSGAKGSGGWAVPYIDLGRQYVPLRDEILTTVDRIFAGADFVLREDLDRFETAIAEYLGVTHAIGVNSGTDALMLSVRALGLGPGDEVITVAHTFVSTLAAIVHAGADPIPVDIGDDYNLDSGALEAALTPRTKAVMPVHLNGRTCDMELISEFASEHGLLIIEDAAQALGAALGDTKAGAFGDTGCFSLHPMKNLSVGGDGGFITTSDTDLAGRLRVLRNIGQEKKDQSKCEITGFGFNSRLDTLQAAIALVKLGHLPGWIDRRREIAASYTQALEGLGELVLPPRDGDGRYDVFSSYVIRTERRDGLMTHMRDDGIEVFAHWVPPLHHQKGLGLDHWRLPETERASRQVLSLPVFSEMTNEETDLVIDSIQRFFRA